MRAYTTCARSYKSRNESTHAARDLVTLNIVVASDSAVRSRLTILGKVSRKHLNSCCVSNLLAFSSSFSLAFKQTNVSLIYMLARNYRNPGRGGRIPMGGMQKKNALVPCVGCKLKNTMRSKLAYLIIR